MLRLDLRTTATLTIEFDRTRPRHAHTILLQNLICCCCALPENATNVVPGNAMPPHPPAVVPGVRHALRHCVCARVRLYVVEL